jgi:hypothetical protein
MTQCNPEGKKIDSISSFVIPSSSDRLTSYVPDQGQRRIDKAFMNQTIGVRVQC